jgi:hypothetical protein
MNEDEILAGLSKEDREFLLGAKRMYEKSDATSVNQQEKNGISFEDAAAKALGFIPKFIGNTFVEIADSFQRVATDMGSGAGAVLGRGEATRNAGASDYMNVADIFIGGGLGASTKVYRAPAAAASAFKKSGGKIIPKLDNVPSRMKDIGAHTDEKTMQGLADFAERYRNQILDNATEFNRRSEALGMTTSAAEYAEAIGRTTVGVVDGRDMSKAWPAFQEAKNDIRDDILAKSKGGTGGIFSIPEQNQFYEEVRHINLAKENLRNNGQFSFFGNEPVVYMRTEKTSLDPRVNESLLLHELVHAGQSAKPGALARSGATPSLLEHTDNRAITQAAQRAGFDDYAAMNLGSRSGYLLDPSELQARTAEMRNLINSSRGRGFYDEITPEQIDEVLTTIKSRGNTGIQQMLADPNRQGGESAIVDLLKAFQPPAKDVMVSGTSRFVPVFLRKSGKKFAVESFEALARLANTLPAAGAGTVGTAVAYQRNQ